MTISCKLMSPRLNVLDLSRTLRLKQPRVPESQSLGMSDSLPPHGL